NTVAAWYYEDAGGNTDSSGQGHDITWHSGVSFGANFGLLGQGARITGSPDGQAMAGTPIGNYFTAETWVYFEGPIPGNLYTELINKRNTGDNADYWGIRLQTCGNTPCIRSSIEVMNPNPYAFGLDW